METRKGRDRRKIQKIKVNSHTNLYCLDKYVRSSPASDEKNSWFCDDYIKSPVEPRIPVHVPWTCCPKPYPVYARAYSL